MAIKAYTKSMKKKPLYYLARRWWIKTRHWEYWPMWLVYLPASFYFIYLSLKARSFFFFSAANPSIETGGMFFESKWTIFELIPKAYFPTTIYVAENSSPSMVAQQLEAAGLQFPLIAKPDRGERGWCVQKIHSMAELEAYMNRIAIPFLLQAYVSLPLEFSVFYYRHPDSDTGQVTSVTFKKLLSVTGNGKDMIGQLLLQNDRSFLQYQRLRQSTSLDFEKVLPVGEEAVVVPYGNHVLGALFLNYNHLINDAMNRSFDTISKQINGFYFGRFDLRCTSIEDLQAGKNISILELNGAGAEPAHIYDPHFSFLEAQKVIAQHYTMLYQAAMANKQKGIPFMTYAAYKEVRKAEKAFKQKAVASPIPIHTKG
jgi:hypothetical protein